MTNKEASNKQEKMVADYMGWRTTSGSGSRPFYPGDVASDHFLLECKTHVEYREDITFHKKHWIKISKEARSVNKYPVLVTDNGTQKPQYTWVMVSNSLIISESIDDRLELINRSTSGNYITFNHQTASSLYNEAKGLYFSSKFDNSNLLIMPLSTFRDFYHLEFEC